MSGDNSGSESGSALILALVFVTFVGAIVVATLTYLDTANRATASYRLEKSVVYAADAAAEFGLNRLQSNSNTASACAGLPSNALPATPTGPLNGIDDLKLVCTAVGPIYRLEVLDSNSPTGKLIEVDASLERGRATIERWRLLPRREPSTPVP